ncbi:MAG: hypothetical protein ONA69_01290 [candidate division KSB1 bacterium]|nr:hypothetical protein [candidate division KSB1 bacterium]MDZ7345408.1 hypothetical protein [candidate division KSB1 bacterium]
MLHRDDNRKPFLTPSGRAKIASTLAAFFIWLMVVAGDTYTYETEIPIEIVPLEKDIILTSPPPQKARVLLEGEGRFLFTFLLFREGALRMNVGSDTGRLVIYPGEKDIFLVGGGQNLIVRRLLRPDSLVLHVDKLITRELPIENRVTLKSAPGYTIVGRPQLTPDVVKVRGPQSLLAPLKAIATEEQIWEDLRFPIEKKVALVRPINRASLSPQEIVINADVQKLMERKFTDIPVTVRNLPAELDAFVVPSGLAVTIVGGVNVVSQIQASDIRAYIDYQTDADHSVSEFPVTLEPLPNVRFHEVQPERFKVIIQHRRVE